MKNKELVDFPGQSLPSLGTWIETLRRQHAIGKYIGDFCSPKGKLVIELDGSQHLDQEEQDAERTLYLESQGYKVIRFWNNQVMNDIEGVIREIINTLGLNGQGG